MLSLIASKALLAALTLSPVASAGKTQSVSNWGDNPSGLPAMLVYTPDKIAEKPAIILGVRNLLPIQSFPNTTGLSNNLP